MANHDFTGLEEQLNIERRKVDVGNVSFSVREIVRMFEENELSIAPSYQRKYRWPAKVASAFIESMFLGLPIPPIFVATNDNFQWEVVDGLQRVSTLISFLSDDPESLERIGRKEPLKLVDLAKLSQLNGTTFGDLPVSLQRYFSRQPLQLVSLTDKSDKLVRFDLFERLNSGAISLTPQEVRSAVYQGKFIDFVEERAATPHFSSLLKLKELDQSDGTAAEQVLKFFAYKNYRDNFKGAVAGFLNKYTDEASQSFDYLNESRVFDATFSFLSETMNGGPFLRSSTSVTPLVHFEAVAVAVAELLEEGKKPVAPDSDWMHDSELVTASTGGTNTRSMLTRRITRARELFSSND
ncbi:DUF262 domain-containing protein [Microbacterium esteraromaticum]|uniref:DUF262 domain-containing protein n=1 Tax=Microbacterium esteraromaticum TaxID=57043 RepID=UPI001C96A262|nr:DUF262 domain-containing protein [Microbacterium esteraromaticum]MBY6060064.1 DUF262 domain-containing protein [Microbacterium esteraromaticum]